MVLENAKVIALTGNNAFSVKKLLSVDDVDYKLSGLKSGEPVHGMSRLRTFTDGILQVANMQRFFKEHSAGFSIDIRMVYGKNIRKAIIRWIPITVCSI